MKWKNRLTNYNFWISIVSAVLLILQAFNFEFDIAYISEIATAVLGLLVVIGIISDPTRAYTPTETNKAADANNAEEIEEKSKTEKETVEYENNTNALDVKNENDNVNNESNFQTIIDFISNEINKTINDVLKVNETEKQEEIEDHSCNIVN